MYVAVDVAVVVVVVGQGHLREVVGAKRHEADVAAAHDGVGAQAGARHLHPRPPGTITNRAKRVRGSGCVVLAATHLDHGPDAVREVEGGRGGRLAGPAALAALVLAVAALAALVGRGRPLALAVARAAVLLAPAQLIQGGLQQVTREIQRRGERAWGAWRGLLHAGRAPAPCPCPLLLLHVPARRA